MSIHQALWVGGSEEEPSDIYVSYLYPVLFEDAVDLAHMVTGGAVFIWLPGEIDVTHALVSGVLAQPLSSYLNWPAENVDVSHTLVSGALIVVLKSYTNWPPDNVDVSYTLPTGVLTQVVFFYLNWPPDNVDVSHSFIGGVLT